MTAGRYRRWRWVAARLAWARTLVRRTLTPTTLTPTRATIAVGLIAALAAGALAIGPWPREGGVTSVIRSLVDHEPTSSPAPPTPPPAPHPVGSAPTPSPPPGSLGRAAPPEFIGWAILDQQTGAITGSLTLADTSTTASMIKSWLVADYLRQAAEAGRQPGSARLDQFRLVIRDSNNEYTQQLFQELGHHQSIERLIQICELTDSEPYPYSWSDTRLSARDTARMGACLADGRAAGPEWTEWVLAEMRAVRGVGDFGIRQAFPESRRAEIAIKNGWVIRSQEHAWHVNCLAIGDGWSMGVLTRYPTELGYEHGAEICQSLAAAHLR